MVERESPKCKEQDTRKGGKTTGEDRGARMLKKLYRYKEKRDAQTDIEAGEWILLKEEEEKSLSIRRM